MSKQFNAWESTGSSSKMTAQVFKGRSHRAVCHLLGKTGEGVSPCTDFPTDAKMQFIKKVYPSLLAEDETQMKEFGPPATCSISFHALNPYLKLWAKSLCSTYKIPSDYKLKGPLFDNNLQ